MCTRQRMTPLSLVRLFALVVTLAVLVPCRASGFATGPSTDALRAAGASEVRDVYVRPPRKAAGRGPLQAVIALHGMGGNGQDFGDALASEADQYGWLIAAPTINYGDWTDPVQITHEEPALVAWLSDEICHLPDRTGYPVQPSVLLFGHSRGAQLSLRLTEIHPEQVAGVAAVSAGTYTLPVAEDRSGNALDFP
jgi:pimeloyl-ACP methyl ester carboxylesterase